MCPYMIFETFPSFPRPAAFSARTKFGCYLPVIYDMMKEPAKDKRKTEHSIHIKER